MQTPKEPAPHHYRYATSLRNALLTNRIPNFMQCHPHANVLLIYPFLLLSENNLKQLAPWEIECYIFLASSIILRSNGFKSWLRPKATNNYIASLTITSHTRHLAESIATNEGGQSYPVLLSLLFWNLSLCIRSILKNLVSWYEVCLFGKLFITNISLDDKSRRCIFNEDDFRTTIDPSLHLPVLLFMIDN